MSKVYQVTMVNMDSVKLEDNYTHPFFEEICLYLNDDDISHIGFSNDDKIFTTLGSLKFRKLISVLKNYFEVDIIDITKEVINGRVQKEYPEIEKISPNLFTNFRNENETFDDILDKIIESGIDSLDIIDRLILKKSHSF